MLCFKRHDGALYALDPFTALQLVFRGRGIAMKDVGFVYLADFEEHAKTFQYWHGFEESFPPPEGYHEQFPTRQADLLLQLPNTGRFECETFGHQMLVDRGACGPDSGNADHECLHCGMYFPHTLY